MGDYGSRYPEPRGNKMIYFLIFIIVLLLIAAGGMVYYFSSQMMEMKKEVASVRQSAAQVQPALEPTPAPAPVKAAPAKLATEDIATIVQVVMSQIQKNQKPPAPSAPVQTTPPPEQTAPAPTVKTPRQDAGDDLESMIDVLGSVDVDTVEEKPLSIAPDKQEALMQTQAAHAPRKAKDNFNKVVVADDGSDEFAQLGSEIDQLVQEGGTEESGYEKQMKKEVAERQNEMRTIVVREGDTLISMAKKAYGDGRKYTKILRANPGIIKNPDRIFVGQVLRVPR